MPSSKPRPPRRSSRVATGRHFEHLAETYFTKQGFTVLDRNFRSGSNEIDLIIRRDSLIVFVEVKSSRTDSFGHPAERVDERKQAHLTEAAHRFIAEHDTAGCDLRFDLITFSGGKLEHYPNAFLIED